MLLNVSNFFGKNILMIHCGSIFIEFVDFQSNFVFFKNNKFFCACRSLLAIMLSWCETVKSRHPQLRIMRH